MVSVVSKDRFPKIGNYQVVKHIATGGMGAVYKAVSNDDGRTVALKVLAPDIAADLAMRGRLRREALHGAKLQHENIVAMFEFGETDGTFYLAMEYVHGKNLKDYLDRHGPLPVNLAIHLLAQVAAALHHIHDAGFIHRDVKPSNILLTRKEGRPLAKLADLGLIRETREDEFRLTREGHTVGTIDYLAPEQARDSSAADIRSDIYSLGCTLFQMLTGSPPFPNGTLVERLVRHAEITAPDVRIFNTKVPETLAVVCRRMLAKKPEQRYQTPAELLAALTLLQSAPPPLELTPSPPETPESQLKTDEIASATSPQHLATGHFACARALIEAGSLRGGIRLLFLCCRLDPPQLAYRKALRDALRQFHGPKSAWSWWTGLRVELRRWLMHAAKKFARPHRVLEHGEHILGYCPRDLNTHLLLAEAALTCRWIDLAHWLLDQAEQAIGPHRQLHRAAALFWECLGDHQQAMAYWQKVDQSDPGNGEARHHLKDLAARETLERNHLAERHEPASAVPPKVL